jgi:hypothetical protein
MRGERPRIAKEKDVLAQLSKVETVLLCRPEKSSEFRAILWLFCPEMPSAAGQGVQRRRPEAQKPSLLPRAIAIP